MHVEIGRHAGLDLVQELPQLEGPMACLDVATTCPVLTLSAANKDVVPCRR